MNKRLKRIFTSYLRRATANRLNCRQLFSIQRELRHDIIRLEREIQKIPARITAIQKSNSTRKRELLERLEDRRWILKRSRAALLLIGDTLVYRHIPAEFVRALHANREPGFLAGKAGGANEVRILRSLALTNNRAFLADTTNCIRVGDIYGYGSRGPFSIEVKSSRSPSSIEDPREKRQLLRQEAATRVIEGTFPGYSRATAEVKIRDHWGTIRNILNKAKQRPVFRTIEPGLFYAAMRNVDDVSPTPLKFKKLRPGPLIFGLLSERLKPEYGGLRPFTLELPTAQSYEIVASKIFLTTFIDMDYLQGRLATVGVSLHKAKNGFWLDGVGPSGAQYSFSPHHIHQVSFAGASLDGAIAAYAKCVQVANAHFAKPPASEDARIADEQKRLLGGSWPFIE
jgi:hypothetical protein